MAEYDNDKWKRSLPYPLVDPEYSEYSENTSGVVTNPTPDFFPVDEPDEVIDIHFRMSMSQFTAIASAIDIGRDIGFGERSYELWRTWCKALIGKIIVSCEDIADCIETDEATQEAIAEAITINQLIQNAVIEQLGGLGNPNRVNATRTTIPDRNLPSSLQQPVREMLSCNLDELWSGIREIVSRLDDVSRDLLEDLATYNDLPQRYQAFIDVVPILGDVAEGVATAATELIPDILNAYNSHSSEAVIDEIACDLFGMVCAECRFPTFEEIYNYYSSLGFEMESMDAQTTALLVGKLSLMMAGTPVPSVVYFSTVTFNLFTLYLQATWNGNSGTLTIEKWAQIGVDFASNNWIDLCDSCDEQYAVFVYDFTKSQGDSYLDSADGLPDEGLYIAGRGWRLTNSGAGQRLEIAMPFQSTWKVRAVAALTTGGTITARSFAFRPTQGTTTGQFVPNPSGCTGDYSHAAQLLNGITGYTEIATAWQVAVQNTPTFLEKFAIVFDLPFSKPGAIPNSSQTLCS